MDLRLFFYALRLYFSAITYTFCVCNSMQIEYDTNKRLKTLLDRKIDFADFPLVFVSKISRERDPCKTERRWQIFGYLGQEMVFAVYTMRRKEGYAANFRVLSMRKVGKNERKETEFKSRQPHGQRPGR